MAKKKTHAKRAPALVQTHQEMSTAAVWWWLVGGLVVLAIVFALLEILAGRYLA